VPIYGPIGAGVTWVVLNAAYFVVLAPRVLARLLPGSYWRWLLYDVLCPVAASVGILGLALLIAPEFGAPWLVLAFVMVAGGVALLGSLLAAHELRSQVVAMVQTMLSRRSAKSV
jgi:hypothetical protein